MSEDEIDLLSVGRVLWRRKITLAISAAVGLVIALAVVVSQPRLYTAEATLLPLPESDPASTGIFTASLGAKLGPLAALIGGGVSGKEPDLSEVLNSRTLTLRVIERCGLDEGGREKPGQALIDAVRAQVAIKPAAASKVIRIQVEDTSPERAAAIADAYVAEVDVLLDEMARSAAARNRRLIEARLAKTSHALASAEDRLAQYKKKPPVAGAPDVAKELNRLQREVDLQNSIYLALVQQNETAGIKEDKGSDAFVPLDAAALSIAPVESRRSLLLVLGVFSGLAVGVMIAFVRNRLEA